MGKKGLRVKEHSIIRSASRSITWPKRTIRRLRTSCCPIAMHFIGNIHLAEAQYLAAVKNKQTSEEVYRLTELRYKNGEATQTDVLAAAAQVSEVDAALVGALLNYNMYRERF